MAAITSENTTTSSVRRTVWRRLGQDTLASSLREADKYSIRGFNVGSPSVDETATKIKKPCGFVNKYALYQIKSQSNYKWSHGTANVAAMSKVDTDTIKAKGARLAS